MFLNLHVTQMHRMSLIGVYIFLNILSLSNAIDMIYLIPNYLKFFGINFFDWKNFFSDNFDKIQVEIWNGTSESTCKYLHNRVNRQFNILLSQNIETGILFKIYKFNINFYKINFIKKISF